MSMATRYLAGKLLAALRRIGAGGLRPCAVRPIQIRRRRRPSSGGCTFSNGRTKEAASSLNVGEGIQLLLEEVAKIEAASKEIAETTRYNRFHRRCIMGSVVLGMGLSGVSCVWYTRSYRNAVKEVFRELEPELKHEILRKYSSPSN